MSPRPPLSRPSAPLLAVAALSACTAGKPESGETGETGIDPPTDGLHVEVVEALPTTLLPGEPAELTVVVLDADDAPITTPLDVRVDDGAAPLAEARTEDGRATLVVTVDRCASLAPTVHVEGASPLALAPLAVAPAVSLVEGPGPLVSPGPLGDLTVALAGIDGVAYEGDDADLSLSGEGDGVTLAGASATAAGGTATFAGAQAAGAGVLTLLVRGEAGCPVEAALPPLVVAEAVRTEPAWLPAARVGEDYAAALPDEPDAIGALPAGLERSGAWIAGVPAASGATLVEAVTWDGSTAHRRLVHLAALPTDDADLPAPAFPAADPGPYATDAVELTIPELTVSTGTWRSVRVRVAFPSDGAGGVAPGRFPLIAFHHAAHSPSDIYDAYTDLHGHWASHGAIVASVDSHVNVDDRSQSWTNLSDMSVFQRGAAALLEAADADPASPFYGHVDVDRVWVSGHSRGGGASLISLWRDPSLSGAICFEPVSPLQTPGQDWGDDAENADRLLPARPVLVFVGALDTDEPWPLPDISYEQTTGPATLVTIHGANHEDTYDEGTPGRTTSTSTIPVAARHDVDQHYSTAFLYRFGGLGDPAGDLAWDAALFGPDAAVQPLAPEGVSVHGRRFVASAATLDAFGGDAEENDWGGIDVAAATITDANEEPYEDGLRAVNRYDERGTRIAAYARARHLAWEDADAELDVFLDPEGGAVDVTTFRAVVVRLQRDCPPPGYGSCPDRDVDLELALWDADGHEASAPLDALLGDRGIVGRHWGTARIDLDALDGVDLAHLEGVALRLGARGWDDGDLWVDDLRFE